MMLVPGSQTVVGNLTVAGEIVGFGNRVPTDGMGDLRVSQKRVVISLSEGHPSVLRDHVRLSGAVGASSVTSVTTQAASRISVSTNASDSAAVLESARKGRADVGRTVEAGLVVRPGVISTATSTPTRYALRWGYFEENCGYLFFADEAGIGVELRAAGGATTRRRRQEWNVDPLDGTGPSGLTVDDLGRQHGGDDDADAPALLFQILFTWNAACAVVFRVVLVTPEGGQFVQVVHREDASTVATHRVLPLRVESEMTEVDGDSTGEARVLVAGRYFSIVGGSDDEVRWGTSAPPRVTTPMAPGVDVDLTVARDVFRPLLSVRLKSDMAHVGGELGEVEVVLDSLFPDMLMLLLQVRQGAQLSNPSPQWEALPHTDAEETALQQDTTSASLTGGTVLFSSFLVFGNGQSRQATLSPRVHLSNRTHLTVCVAPVFKVGAAPHTRGAVSCLARTYEGW